MHSCCSSQAVSSEQQAPSCAPVGRFAGCLQRSSWGSGSSAGPDQACSATPGPPRSSWLVLAGSSLRSCRAQSWQAEAGCCQGSRRDSRGVMSAARCCARSTAHTGGQDVRAGSAQSLECRKSVHAWPSLWSACKQQNGIHSYRSCDDKTAQDRGSAPLAEAGTSRTVARLRGRSWAVSHRVARAALTAAAAGTAQASASCWAARLPARIVSSL